MRHVFYIIAAIGLFLSGLDAFSQEGGGETGQRIRITPIQALVSSGAPKDFVWVHVHVINADEEDTFTIEDSSGSMILFLPTDELIAQQISLKSELYILGRVDISPVHPSKNELYAERIVVAEKQ